MQKEALVENILVAIQMVDPKRVERTGPADSARDRLHDVLASEPSFTLDYAEIINEDNFEPATSPRKGRAIVAGWVNGVRLLDNMPMAPQQQTQKVSP